MRILMMISNRNMGVREMYTMVLNSRFPGWGLSHMSALPASPATIIQSYDALLYELDAPDDPKRYQNILTLWEQLKPLESVKLVTHIEGPYRDGVVAELESQGVIVAGTPFTLEAIAAALQRAAPPQRGKTAAARDTRRGGLRGFLRRKE